MKTFILFILTLFTFQSHARSHCSKGFEYKDIDGVTQKVAKNGLSICKNKKGKKEREFNYKNGLKQGKAQSWNYNGTKASKENYKDDKLEGLQIYYDNKGDLQKKWLYKNGVRQGAQEFYYSRSEGGKLQRRVNYENNEESGPVVEFHKNGKKRAEYSYKVKDGRSRIDGLKKEYDEKGKIKSEKNYKTGKRHGLEKKYLSSRKIERICWDEGRAKKGLSFCTKNKKDDQNMKSYWSNGELHEQYSIKNEKKVGEYKSFHRNGKLHETAKYVKGGIHGEYKKLSPEGKLLITRLYHKGDLKEEKEYYMNQDLKAQYSFKGRYKDGPFKKYHPNGKVSQEGSYSKGRLEGKLTEYDEEGVEYSMKTYKKGLLHGLRKYYYFDQKKRMERRDHYEEGKLSYYEIKSSTDKKYTQYYPDGSKILDK